MIIQDKYLSHDGGKSVKYYHYSEGLDLECGEHLEELDIAYVTYGTMNADQSNVVWMCHAYTANADPVDWWPGMVGEGKFFDPAKYFIVCANILGSCYGTTGPLSINPKTGKPYYRSFPLITDVELHGAVLLNAFWRDVLKNSVVVRVDDGADGQVQMHSLVDFANLGLVNLALENHIAHIGHHGDGGTVVKGVRLRDAVALFDWHVDNHSVDG